MHILSDSTYNTTILISSQPGDLPSYYYGYTLIRVIAAVNIIGTLMDYTSDNLLSYKLKNTGIRQFGHAWQCVKTNEKVLTYNCRLLPKLYPLRQCFMVNIHRTGFITVSHRGSSDPV